MTGARFWIGIAAVALFFVLLGDPRPLVLFRKHVLDLELSLRPAPAPAKDKILIVDIDEASLRAFGQWPWPRKTLARLIDALRENGAKVIALDTKFPESDRLGAEEDMALANAIALAPVILGQETSPAASPGVAPRVDLIVKGGRLADHCLVFPGASRNLPLLEEAARDLGYYSLSPEEDGVVRRLPMVVIAGGQPGLSLSAQALRLALDARRVEIDIASDGIEDIRIGDLTIPTDGSGRIWLASMSADPAIRASAAAVLDNRVPRDRIAGRIVLVGASAGGLNDLKITPLAERVPGVDIHAAAIAAALGGRIPVRPSYAFPLELGAFLLGAACLMIWLPNLSAYASGLATIAVASSLILAGILAFAVSGLLIDGATPALAVLVLGAGSNLLQWNAEEGRRRYLRRAFGQYLAPTMIDRLMSAPEALKLGGEVRTITIIFADLRGFTRLAEASARDPAQLTATMNRMFTAMADAVLSEEGTIDKLVGDSMIALWNAPLDQPDHALRALRAARKMVEATLALDLRIGVGINTGACFVGNMGAAQRFDYTALGDPVNVAARLQDETKTRNVPILIGPETASALAPILEAESLIRMGAVKLQGRSEPIEIFALKSNAEGRLT